MSAVRWLSLFAVAALGLFTPGRASAQQDPGTPGFHSVTVTEYGSNSTSISLGEISVVEVLAQVHYPTDLQNGPYPLVILLHGRHPSCYLSGGGGVYAWPCGASQTPVPSYKGYDYLASLLASHGMIVASISANGINAADNGTSTFGMEERSQLIQHHLGKWKTFNSVAGGAPFGTTFAGRVDLFRVGTMGHSRGGEGVIWNYERNLALGKPYGIQAVLPLAPVDFFGHFINDVPVGVVLPYCDGDVFELPGVAFFDDPRYNTATDQAPKHTFLSLGSNHNYFNRYWTPDQFAFATSDDWAIRDFAQTDPWCGTSAAGNGRLTSAKQRGFGAAYMAAFFRRYLLGARQFDKILLGEASPPPSAQTSAVYTGYFPGDSDRKDLNRLSVSSEMSTNTLGGSVTSSGLVSTFLCGDWTGVNCVTGREPHYPSLSSYEVGWTSLSAWYSNQLPLLQRDVSNFTTIQFRVSVDYSSSRNTVGQAQNFSIRLVDGAGRSATVKVSDYSGLLYYPPAGGVIGGTDYNWRKASVMNTLRIPLTAFTGVDKTSLVSVDLLFNQKSSGELLLSDFAFADEGISTAEVWTVTQGALTVL